MFNKKSYALSSAVVRLGYWTKSVEDNADLILSVIDLLKKFDKLNDGTVNDKNMFIDFITNCSSKTIDSIVSMDVKELVQFDPYGYTTYCDVFLTPEMIMSKVNVCDCSNADIDDIKDIVDKVIKNYSDFTLRDGVRDNAIERLTKIKEFIENNHISIGDDEAFQSCLIFSVKYDI